MESELMNNTFIATRPLTNKKPNYHKEIRTFGKKKLKKNINIRSKRFII